MAKISESKLILFLFVSLYMIVSLSMIMCISVCVL